MKESDNRFDATGPDSELGMNFISTSFDLVMVNRVNERFYGKPAVAMLGRKCYAEFERRSEPCPHCPGRLALATGETRETERVVILDDGTLSAVRIRAYPVMGPDDRPTGFIEEVEDITEEKRGERLMRVEEDLLESLIAARSSRRALGEVLDAAMQMGGIDWACVFTVDRRTGDHTLLGHQNVLPEWIGRLTAASRGDSAATPGSPDDPQVLQVVPITRRGSLVGTLLAGSSTHRELPPAVKTGLHSLGTIAGNAISRILAERSLEHAIADFEAFIAIIPLPIWVLDDRDHVVMWNKAAERLLGWEAAEMLGKKAPFEPPTAGPQVVAVVNKQGDPLRVRLTATSFREVMRSTSSTVVLAEDLTHGTTADLGPTGIRETRDHTCGDREATVSVWTPRVLIIDSDETWGDELAQILKGLGCAPTRCFSVEAAAELLAEADTQEARFDVAVVGVVPSQGMSGLDQKAALRMRGFTGPVLLSSETEVRGHEHHGIAAVVRRPYSADAVGSALRVALKQIQ